MNEQDMANMPEDTTNSVTEEKIEDEILFTEYVRVGKKTVVCCITLQNGFEVIGTSACVDPKNFDLEKGKYWARKNAFDKIWELEGYALAKKLVGRE